MYHVEKNHFVKNESFVNHVNAEKLTIESLTDKNNN